MITEDRAKEVARLAYEDAQDEWFEYCGHDHDVPHYSGPEDEFTAWVAMIIELRRNVRQAYLAANGRPIS